MRKRSTKNSNFIHAKAVVRGLEKIGLEYLVYLPDSTMRPILDHFEKKPEVTVVPLNREDEGVGIVAGLEAAKKSSVLMIQDSGLGNMMNSLVTLGSLYRIPILIIAVRRGGFGEINIANAEFGEIAIELMAPSRTMGFILDYKVPLNQWSTVVKSSYDYAHFVQKPIVLFVNLKV